MSKLAELKKQNEINKMIEAKLASGKFVDTGKKYNASEAVADASNASLRMTAVVSDNGELTWKR